MFKLDINRNDVLNTKYGRAKINYYGYYVITNCKEDNHGKFLHKLIYEDNYGDISDGYHIHHINGDKLNNCIENLKLMSESEHRSYHMKCENNSNYNQVLKIRKKKDKSCNQGYIWRCRPYTNKGEKNISSVDLDICILNVEKFLKSEENTKGYIDYEIINNDS